ncbi:MAG: SpoIIIAH-like family protein [Eubacteriales bacterium]
MKRVVKKNQIVITTLALMIAVAGYLNYSGEVFDLSGEVVVETTNDLTNQELLDISEEDIITSGEIASLDEDVIADSSSKEGTPGESVLTSSAAIETIASAKVSREQVRASSKETLQSLIDNEQLTSEQRDTAVNQMISMTQIAEQEVMIETLLEAKGFSDVVVTLTEDSADIVLFYEELTEAHLAQIEDVVTRSTSIAAENVVITPIETTN